MKLEYARHKTDGKITKYYGNKGEGFQWWENPVFTHKKSAMPTKDFVGIFEVSEISRGGLVDGAAQRSPKKYTKLNLAVAAGLALPMLSLLGYAVNAGTENAVALKWTYVALPVAIKLFALFLLTKYQQYFTHLAGK